MNIFCKELNKTFTNKEDLFKELAQNEKTIIDAKKSVIYNTKEWINEHGSKQNVLSLNQNLIKEINLNEVNKEIKFDDNYYYLAVNSAYYLDSHTDVHTDKNWEKTKKEQKGKIYLTWGHDFSNTKSILAFPDDVELLTAYISWKMLGKDYEGDTYCLIYKVGKNSIQNSDVKKWLDEGKSLQLSPRMQYVKIRTCFNSDAPEHKEFKKNFLDVYPKIINKDEFKEDVIYFWAVDEAKNVMEGAILPFGSNSATGRIDNKTTEAVEDTSKIIEPSEKDTQKESKKRVLIFII